MNTTQTQPELKEHSVIEFDDRCPCHGNKLKKQYTFGSTMTAETTVSVFYGCQCAVAERHDPIGILPNVASYHKSYANASGVGRLHALEAAAKYR
jgi:hypothetical protein